MLVCDFKILIHFNATGKYYDYNINYLALVLLIY